MEEVYRRLIEKINNMSKEDIKKEWEELKDYNEIGPEAKSYIHSALIRLNYKCSELFSKNNVYSNKEEDTYYLAA